MPEDRSDGWRVAEKIAGYDYLVWDIPTPAMVEEFATTLEDATDERPLQIFFEKHPLALLTGVVSPHRSWVIPKPRLPEPSGKSWIPDFLVCDWTSLGPEWTIVELESPGRTPLTRAGDPSYTCNHAVGQINSYRTFLEKHGSYIREDGWPRLFGQFKGVVVIGRRSDPMRAKHPERLVDFRRQNVEVMSYDRLLERVS